MNSHHIAPRPTTHWPYANILSLVLEITLLVIAALLLTVLFQGQLASSRSEAVLAPAPPLAAQVHDTWYLEP
ncbi:MAG: hypothetical protein WCI67_12285 [Chloroflexales bacterium]